MKYSLAFLSVFCYVWLLQVAGAYAQGLTNIVGVVCTVDKQVLAKAEVVVLHLPSGVKRAAKTGADGKFAVDDLAVGGPYRVRVNRSGFQPATINDVFLVTGKTANGTFVLQAEERGTRKKNRNEVAEAENAKLLQGTAAAVVAGPPATAPRYHLTYIEQCRIAPSGLPGFPGSTVAAGPVAPQPQAARTPVGTTPLTASSAVPAAAGRTPALAPVVSSAGKAAPRVASAKPLPAPVASVAPAYSGEKSSREKPYVARRPATRIVPPSVSGHYDPKSGNYIYHTGAATTLRLPNGQKLEGVGINSTESMLHRFISDTRVQVDTVDLTNGWMSFDRVYFESGKATLTKESMTQLRHVARIMQAYPQVRLKIGGYTDSTGTYKVNRMLSEARARTAWASLVEMGVSPARLDARGYGSNYPVATNETEVGRAMNRRLSLKVLQK